ncbi:MAG: hypothetical protein JWP81_4106 [Ferruginibacter sp.]|nr:hypothetical protein [Ferruginibacter sp.]
MAWKGSNPNYQKRAALDTGSSIWVQSKGVQKATGYFYCGKLMRLYNLMDTENDHQGYAANGSDTTMML